MINENQIDIVNLSETWLRDNKNLLDYVKIPGYNFVYKNREQKPSGGLGAYLKEELYPKYFNKIDTTVEQLRLEIKGKNKKASILSAILYQPSLQIEKNPGRAGQNWNYAINNCVEIHRNNCFSWRYKRQCKRAIKTPKTVPRNS